MASVNNIQRFRETRGWSRPTLAEKMKTSPQQVEKLEKGLRRLTQDWIDRASEAFEVPPSSIISDENIPDAKPPLPNGTPFKMEGASLARMQQDLPIYGTALGASREIDGEAIEQTTLNQGEIVTYAKRPVILDGRTDAYGLYVVGSSMYPAHAEGSTILVETKRPPRVGDDVVVYLRPEGEDDDGERARGVLVKRLVRRTHSYVELEQFSPPLVFKIKADDIVRIDRVMPLGDLLS